ncbi:Microtubule-associated serine/threonine-protein kinase 1 [Trichinella patagoniensis]|uniref:non-specific serine/threonine protein kinase n=1 Tax=Trichinella patagoniensis TaxID=990121 RepID=A0A0V1A3Q6_9BILA|nr:Microtubule-associated serine/threonine-protein kinase 1 [Trichinella patagoniensis]
MFSYQFLVMRKSCASNIALSLKRFFIGELYRRCWNFHFIGILIDHVWFWSQWFSSCWKFAGDIVQICLQSLDAKAQIFKPHLVFVVTISASKFDLALQSGLCNSARLRTSLSLSCPQLSIAESSMCCSNSQSPVPFFNALLLSVYSSQEKLANALTELKINNSGSNDSCSYCEESTLACLKSPALRWRSRSFSSFSNNVSVCEYDDLLRSSLYKSRFPKAKQNMEEKLEKFIADNSVNPSLVLDISDNEQPVAVIHPNIKQDPNLVKLFSDGCARFIHHQIVELASDCLLKSKEEIISSVYFYEMTENQHDYWNVSYACLVFVLLMLYEFDPKEFYHLLKEMEEYAKEQQSRLELDIPHYVISKLGLTNDVNSDKGTNDQKEQQQLIACGSNLIKAENGKGKPQQQSSDAFDHVTNNKPLLKEEDFQVMKLISNGAYGSVYLVRAKETRKRFALKKLRKSSLILRNQLEQVFAERDIMTFSDNPFVVSFYGSFETKTHLCMLMEYVEGGDCASLLKQIGVFPVEMARLYIAEAVLAVEYLHSYGIVHRDLKPDNLLITAMGHVKLTDFGLSKIGLMNRTTLLCEDYFDVSETQQFRDRQICGTPEYIAPEVILRQGYDEIEFPEDPYCPPAEAVDLIRGLLQVNPLDRLGTVGTRTERYNHDVDSGDESWSENSSIFSSFSSCSPRYSLLADNLMLKNNDDSNSLLLLSEDGTDQTFVSSTEENPNAGKRRSVGEEELCSFEGEALNRTDSTISADSSALPKLSVSLDTSDLAVQLKGNDVEQHLDTRSCETPVRLNVAPPKSTGGLHLIIPSDVITPAVLNSPSQSSNSSHDCSPNCCSSVDIAPVVHTYKPTVTFQRGSLAFGFSIKSIRVYLGQTDFYTIQHIVSAVEKGSAAYQNGLRVNDLITHVDGTAVQNFTQPELLRRLMRGGGQWVTIRATSLDQTSIRLGRPRRAAGRLARRVGVGTVKQKLQRRAWMEKRKAASLFRRMSGKRHKVSLSVKRTVDCHSPCAMDAYKKVYLGFPMLIILCMLILDQKVFLAQACIEGQQQCPNGYTCCGFKSGYWRCCPFRNGVCCADGINCCAHNAQCDSEKRLCIKENNETYPTWRNDLLGVPDDQQVAYAEGEDVVFGTEHINVPTLCPDKMSKCDEKSTCCETVHGQWACCSLSKAVCCSDKLHCCPEGTQCDLKHNRCTQENDSSFDNSTTPLYGLNIDIGIPKYFIRKSKIIIGCPEKSQLCRGKHSTGCCPLKNGVCCDDNLSCCPEGYECSKNGKCRKI